MKPVLVDTGGFYALLVPDDPSHPRAKALFDQAGRDRWRLVTTNAVVYETAALLLARSRAGAAAAIGFLDRLERTRIQVERVQPTDEKRATAILRAHPDKRFSLCDALSFVVMERLHIRDAISFDRHFRGYGRFRIL